MPSAAELHEPPAITDAPALSPLEMEAIELFIGFVRLLGLPKSIGEVYGLLFVSPRPLPLEVFMERLAMSRGAASQGLKLLRSLGAVRTVYVAGDRRDHYLADLDLSRFASGFIKEEVQPVLDRGMQRLARMDEYIAELPAADQPTAQEHLARLRHWHEKGQAMLPWVLKFLVS